VSTWRHYLFLVCFATTALALSVRVVYLGVTERDFLQEEGDRRSVYKEDLPAMRGMIYDRNGEHPGVRGGGESQALRCHQPNRT